MLSFGAMMLFNQLFPPAKPPAKPAPAGGAKADGKDQEKAGAPAANANAKSDEKSGAEQPAIAAGGVTSP